MRASLPRDASPPAPIPESLAGSGAAECFCSSFLEHSTLPPSSFPIPSKQSIRSLKNRLHHPFRPTLSQSWLGLLVTRVHRRHAGHFAGQGLSRPCTSWPPAVLCPRHCHPPCLTPLPPDGAPGCLPKTARARPPPRGLGPAVPSASDSRSGALCPACSLHSGSCSHSTTCDKLFLPKTCVGLTLPLLIPAFWGSPPPACKPHLWVSVCVCLLSAPLHQGAPPRELGRFAAAGRPRPPCLSCSGQVLSNACEPLNQ